MKTKNTMMSTLAGLVAAIALALAGCADPASTPDRAGAPRASDASAANADAARFAACLTSAGVAAKVGDNGYVLVKTGSQGAGSGAEVGISSDAGAAGGQPLLLIGDSDGSTWVAAQSSAYFADTPDTHDAYAACETQYPDFMQPEVSPESDPAIQEAQAQQSEDSLAFARCARDAGFAWVADPSPEPGTSPAIALPSDLTEAEFRSLLQACGSSQLSLAWLIEDELSFDWMGVLDEALEQSTGGSVGRGSIGGGR